MQLSYDQRHSIRKYRFFNHVLLENIPLIFIQIYAIITNIENSIIIYLSLFFSMLSIFILLPKLLFRVHKNRQQSSTTKIIYEIEIKSNEIRHNHKYCHQLLADTLLPFFIIQVNRIETLSISSNKTKQQKSKGIICNIQISSNEDESKIDNQMRNITNNESDICDSFKALLCKLMALKKNTRIDLKLSKSGDRIQLSQHIQNNHHRVPIFSFSKESELKPRSNGKNNDEESDGDGVKSQRDKPLRGGAGDGGNNGTETIPFHSPTVEHIKAMINNHYYPEEEMPPLGNPSLMSVHSMPVNLNKANERISDVHKKGIVMGTVIKVPDMNDLDAKFKSSSADHRDRVVQNGYHSENEMDDSYRALSNDMNPMSLPQGHPNLQHVSTWSEATSMNSGNRQHFNMGSNGNGLVLHQSGSYNPHVKGNISIYSVSNAQSSYFSQNNGVGGYNAPDLYGNMQKEQEEEDDDAEELYIDLHKIQEHITKGGTQEFSGTTHTAGGDMDDIEEEEKIKRWMKRKSKRMSQRANTTAGHGPPYYKKENNKKFGPPPKDKAIHKNLTPRGGDKKKKVKFQEDNLSIKRPVLRGVKSQPIPSNINTNMMAENTHPMAWKGHGGYNVHIHSPVNKTMASSNYTPTEGKSKQAKGFNQNVVNGGNYNHNYNNNHKRKNKNKKVVEEVMVDMNKMNGHVNISMRKVERDVNDAASDAGSEEENMVYFSDPDDIGGADGIEESSTFSANNAQHILIDKDDYETPHETDHESDGTGLTYENRNKKVKVQKKRGRNGQYHNKQGRNGVNININDGDDNVQYRLPSSNVTNRQWM